MAKRFGTIGDDGADDAKTDELPPLRIPVTTKTYVSEDEARIYWAGGRTPEEADRMRAEYSETVGDTVRYFLP